MAVDPKEYNRDYYEKNREALSERRKAKYKDDPEYAAKAKERSKLRRMEAKIARQKERLKSGQPLRATGGGPRKPVPVVLSSGKVVMGFTVGEVARRIGKTYFTLKKWRQLGVLPESPLKTDAGHGLYTEEMINVLKSAVARRIEVSASDKTFTEEVSSGWEGVLS